MTIKPEITKINQDQDKMYIASSYPHSGLFDTTNGIMFVNKDMNSALWLGNGIEMEQPTTQQSSPLTESFILKLVALTANKEKFSEL